MEEEIKEVVVEKIYVGPILFEDGWYKMYSDGNKHYTYEKCENGFLDISGLE